MVWRVQQSSVTALNRNKNGCHHQSQMTCFLLRRQEIKYFMMCCWTFLFKNIFDINIVIYFNLILISIYQRNVKLNDRLPPVDDLSLQVIFLQLPKHFKDHSDPRNSWLIHTCIIYGHLTLKLYFYLHCLEKKMDHMLLNCFSQISWCMLMF